MGTLETIATSLLLTGATGLVGSRLPPRLDEAGFDCRALVRGDVALPPGPLVIRGDLADPDSLQPAVEGVEAVVHLAALFRTDDEDAIWRANLDGTRNLIARCRRARTRGALRRGQHRQRLQRRCGAPEPGDRRVHAHLAYPGSKVAAEALLRASRLTWSILRLPFVYGDGDGHLASMPALARRFGLLPANAYSVGHHRDVMTAVGLVLSGAMDARSVNVADDAPVTVLKMTELSGNPIEGSAEPLANPWSGRIDTTLAHQLGYPTYSAHHPRGSSRRDPLATIQRQAPPRRECRFVA